MLPIEPDELTRFFNGLRSSNLLNEELPEEHIDTRKLGVFFDALRKQLAAWSIEVSERAAPIEIDASALQIFLGRLKPEIEVLRARGGFCNPWKVASLKSNEVRNTAVLAWLLNPNGDHGLGALMLDALLARVHEWQADMPQSCSGRARVVTEVNPEGERGDRVDIEIDSEQFYMLLEVKIDAAEGLEQLSRYIKACENLACQRPWAIVFLTRDGRLPSTAGEQAHRVFSISWKRLANTLLRALNKQQRHERANDFNVRLAALFLRQVRNF